MKKLMRKLILSSFALGLAVVTLTTTTFAWYTSNTDVTAKEIQGTSAASGSALLMISNEEVTDGNHPYKWETKIDNVQEKGSHTQLTPLQYGQKGGYGDYVEDTTNVAAPTAGTPGTKGVTQLYGIETNAVATNGWLEFTLYFKNASMDPNVELFISSMTFKNSATTLPVKDILAEGRTVLSDLDSTTTIYSVDILRTLMVATSTIVVTKEVPADSSIEAIYNPEGLFTSYKDNGSFNPEWNAHEYYNAVMTEGKKVHEYADGEYTYGAKTIYTTGNEETDNRLKICSLPVAGDTATANSYAIVTFRIFINGWDKHCFDACQEQTFTLELGFTTLKAEALFIK